MSAQNENRHCTKCDLPDSADNMVCCDKCEVWEHFNCAGVTDSIADPDRSWKCSKCRMQSDAVSASKSILSLNSSSSKSSRRSQVAQLNLELLEKQRALRLKGIEEEEQYLKQKYDLLKQISEEEEAASRSSGASRRSKRERVESWLIEGRSKDQENRQVIGTMSDTHPANQEYVVVPGSTHLEVCNKESLVPASRSQSVSKELEHFPQERPPQITSTPNILDSQPEPVSVVTSKQSLPVHHSLNSISVYPRIPPTTTTVGKTRFSLVQGIDTLSMNPITTSVTVCECSQTLGTNVSVTNNRQPINTVTSVTYTPAPLHSSQARPAGMVESIVPRQTSFPTSTIPSTNMNMPSCIDSIPHGYETLAMGVAVGPTTVQLAARQVIPRELPTFHGDPEEWPIFYSSFRNSTEVCGYNDAENLSRLQRCLRGHALDAVKSRLLLPASVPHVMETLKKLYGRPEILINSLLRNVRSVPPPKSENLNSLISYGLAVQNLVDHITLSEQRAHLSNPMLLQELVEKLPTSYKMQWGYFKRTRPYIDLETFKDFMSDLVNLASDLTVNVDTSLNQMKTSKSDKGMQKEKLFVHSHDSVESDGPEDENKQTDLHPSKVCSHCERDTHLISDCHIFKSLNVDSRWKAVRQKQLCRLCLVPHRKWPCRSKRECGISGCRVRHHALLHNPQKRNEQNDASISESTVYQNLHLVQSQTLFRYLPVTLYGKNKKVNTYAFLDDGSSSTLLEAGLAKQLDVVGTPDTMLLQWTGRMSRYEQNSERVCIVISGIGKENKFKLDNVRTVSELGLPRQTMIYSEVSANIPHLKGLPITSYVDATAKIIIGIEHVRLLVAKKIRESSESNLIATKTRLGWCVYGKNSGAEQSVVQLHTHVQEDMSNSQLHESMKQFFLIEEPMVTKKPESDVDRRALEIMERTTVQHGKQYETGLLWRTNNPVLPDSLPMAMNRLKSLERRLAREPELATRVKKLIKDYESKQYAHKLTREELENSSPGHVWYLPLGVVTSTKKPDKTRLVWDASAKVNGTCLNDMLLKGPDLLTSLTAVLIRFRQRRIAVCGDIAEMFHQIRIIEADKQYQRFLWRNSPEEEVQTYVMDVATFGATCSPCSAQFIKNKNALKFAESHPRAVHAITDNHYVDDFLDSVDTVGEAVQLVEDVKQIHAAAGFKIGKFRSSSSEVLAKLGVLMPDANKSLAVDKQSGIERVLGMVWISQTDVITFIPSTNFENMSLSNGGMLPTKRQVLSTVMSIFDPLGLVAHFVVHGKVLMQDVWRSGTTWDEPIADHLHDKWTRWVEMLEKLNEVKVPRCYFNVGSSRILKDLQLHIFVDASEIAYSCVAYLRLNHREMVECALVAAKTKVAPLKPMSIPRLELQAAMIGARLAQNIEAALTLPLHRRILWSDSATVLAWIRSDSRRYHQFVAFRVGEILSLTNVEEWRHVPSKLNVADEATKWGPGPSFQPASRWFQGPEFLLCPEDQWPSKKEGVSTTNEEIRALLHHHRETAEPLIDVLRFSNWDRLLRAVAYVHRAVDIFKNIKGQASRTLSSEDFSKAELTIFLQIQLQSYPEEIEILSNSNRTIAKTSPIYRLSPFLDEAGAIRMGGRIDAAACASYTAKNPMILPKKHPATALLVLKFHRQFLHANNETVHNEMRQQYYIPALRSFIRNVVRNCQLCKIKRAIVRPPQMGPLPRVRLTPFIRPFTYVGVDYFGPLEVKIGRSLAKRWVCLFTCLTVRAIHLEAVHSLSTTSCVMAFRRFIARRGAPSKVYSDNGTNFVGCSRQLTEEMKHIQNINEQCSATFTNAQTSWYFNVPAAPHMGGPWERMVRSVKVAMKAITECNHHQNDEVLVTVLLEAEGVVNSRPLTYVPLETADDEALTPNHFLLYGSSGIKQPSTNPVNYGTALRNSWKFAQRLVDGFWHRWVREYMPMLTRRTKWFEKAKSLEPGDLVVIIDPNIRNLWERGRILETIKGADGQVRRAIVQTARGTFARPAVKLAVLDVGVCTTESNKSGTEAVHGSGDVAAPTGLVK